MTDRLSFICYEFQDTTVVAYYKEGISQEMSATIDHVECTFLLQLNAEIKKIHSNIVRQDCSGISAWPSKAIGHTQVALW